MVAMVVEVGMGGWVREYTGEEGGIVNIELKIWWRKHCKVSGN